MEVKSMSIGPIWPLHSTIAILKFFGLWHEGKFKQQLIIYGFLFHAMFTFVNILALIINTFLNKEAFAKFIYISLTEIAVAVKVGFMLKQSSELVVLKDRLVTLHAKLPEGRYDDEFFEPRLRQISRVIKFYYALVVGSVSNVSFSPLFSSERVMPFNSWFFGLNWQDSTVGYGLLYFLESYGQIAHASSNICWDMVLTFMIVSLTIHVRIVGAKLEKIGWPLEDAAKHEKEFLNCIDYHRELLQLQDEIVKKFAVPMFVQFLVSTGVICAGAFTLSQVGKNSVLTLSQFVRLFIHYSIHCNQLSPLEAPGLFAFFLFYVSSICLQIFIPCYFGNELNWQSAKLPMKIYKSNWYDMKMSNEYRRHVAFLILRVNKPIEINILHFFNLNLQAFEKVRNCLIL